MLSFEQFGIGVLRAYVRSVDETARGLGKLGNVGTKSEVIARLVELGKMPEDVEAFAANEAPKSEKPVAPVINNKGDNGSANATAAIDQALEALKSAIAAATPAKSDTPAVDMAEVIKAATDAAKAEYLKHNPPAVVEVRNNGVTTAKIEKAHKATGKILLDMAAGVNVWLAGPAGSGKTTACEKIADALGLKFYPLSVGGQTTKSDLLGFIDANGVYHASAAVREAFEHGGLLLIDEIDAAGANVLTILNALLANGYCTFPDGTVKRHDLFRCIAAANTFGRGADRQYVGRNQIDAATLNRFAFIAFDYDEDLELALVGDNPLAIKWCKRVQALRHAAENLKMRIVISPRASIYGARMIAAGLNYFDELEEQLVYQGLPTDQRVKLRDMAADEFKRSLAALEKSASVAAD